MDMGCCNSEFHWLSDDRITRETLSYNNPCPSSLSSTILRSAYMALNTTARLATLIKYIYIYIYIYILSPHSHPWRTCVHKCSNVNMIPVSCVCRLVCFGSLTVRLVKTLNHASENSTLDQTQNL